MTKYLFIARHKEDVSWVHKLDPSWYPVIYSAGSSDKTPNSTTGCEAFAYLHCIIEMWHDFRPDDIVAFCQGDPFPHCPNFFEDLETKNYQGRLHRCSGSGLPHCTYLDLGSYCRTFDIPYGNDFPFSEGAHFKTTGEKIRSKPISFYKALHDLVNTPHSRDPKYHAMTMERLWYNVFDIKP
jgi:hypothetical protein